MAIWYSDGTVSVTNGSTTVIGTGTLFVNAIRAGDGFIAPNGVIYEVTNIASDTSFSISKAYTGTTLSGQSYTIIPVQGYNKAAADRLKNFIGATLDNGLAISSGGTGAITAAGARTNLGVYSTTETYSDTEIDGALALKMTASDYVGATGNINAPLTWLPLKKNLLTQQGQSIATFTRASTATYRDRYGVLKSAAADTPRFNENGLLLEGASTNTLLYSEQFDNAVWTKGNSTVSANTTAVTDPYGTNIADKLTESTYTGAHYIYQSQSVTSGTIYTFSMFAKAGERSQIRLYDGTQGGAYFDILNGAIISVESGITASLTSYSNGWYRCSIIYTANATASRNMSVALASASTTSYTGDGTSGLYLLGAQLEALSRMTSYIPTTSAATTRSADNTHFVQSENLPAYSTDFSLVLDVKLTNFGTGYTYIVGDNYSTGLAVYVSSTGVLGVRLGSSVPASGTITVNTKYRVVAVKSGTTISIYLNGILKGTGTATGIPANQPSFYIGSLSGTGGNICGTVLVLKIYDRALTAQEVAAA